jgi:hypothetical protein
MILAAHADWSIDPRKRWMTLAHETAAGWRVCTPELVGTVTDLFSRLRAEATGGPVALGLDLPLGVPRAYAAPRPEADFPRFLRVAAGWRDFFQVCKTLAEVRTDRPFYPARGIKGMTRAAHAAALGIRDAMGLSRLCDRATAERPAGAPVFWTLGANQSGKAAIAAWRDLLAPALLAGAPIRLWPFDGRFRDLLAPDTAAVAETYPAEAQRHLGIRLKGSKRRQTDRAAVAAQLHAAMRRLRARPDSGLRTAIAEGFGADAAGEDRFDCLLGVLCVLNVLAGNRPDTVPDDPWIRRWEGWVLGQTAMPARLPEPVSPLNIFAHDRDVSSAVEGPGS